MFENLTMRDDLPDELQESLKRLRDNIIISLVKRNGGTLEIPAEEIDRADDMLIMEVDQQRKCFIFKTRSRQ
jgi:hypothetical protein